MCQGLQQSCPRLLCGSSCSVVRPYQATVLEKELHFTSVQCRDVASGNQSTSLDPAQDLPPSAPVDFLCHVLLLPEREMKAA